MSINFTKSKLKGTPQKVFWINSNLTSELSQCWKRMPILTMVQKVVQNKTVWLPGFITLASIFGETGSSNDFFEMIQQIFLWGSLQLWFSKVSSHMCPSYITCIQYYNNAIGHDTTCDKSWNVKICHEMSRYVMKCQDMSWNVKIYHEMSRYVMKHHVVAS